MRLSIIMLTIATIIMGLSAAQDFVKGSEAGGPVNLSGMSPDVFDGEYFSLSGWVFDVSGSSITPSQAAFLSGDDKKDGAAYGNRTVLRCGRNAT